MKQLYPIKFTPILKDKIWGGSKLKNILNKNSDSDKIGESWEISGVEGDISLVSNGTFKGYTLDKLINELKGELVGQRVYENFGDQFPLLIKFIDANQDLSIQVHPDDKLAKEKHDSFGKTEMWYVVDADKNCELISGFVKPISKSDYLKALDGGNLMSLLQKHRIKKGDTLFIPAGNVHAIGSGALIAEIQQSSDITYRIYDYDRKGDDGRLRELHTELALDASNFDDSNTKLINTKSSRSINPLVKCNYFTTNILRVNKAYSRDLSVIKSFVVYMCTEGTCQIKCMKGSTENIHKGDTILIPATAENISFSSADNVELLEVYIE